MKVIRGSCNQCGECCGKGTNVPAFGWSFWEICFQTENNPDFPITALSEGRQAVFTLSRNALDKQRKVRIGGQNYDVLLKTGVGLVKSDTDFSCPFVLPDGSCGVWNETWCEQLCHDTFPYDGLVLTPEMESRFVRFKADNPSCSFEVVEE